MAKAKKVTISAILVAVIVACSIPLFSGCGETEHTYSEFQLAYQDFVEEYTGKIFDENGYVDIVYENPSLVNAINGDVIVNDGKQDRVNLFTRLDDDLTSEQSIFEPALKASLMHIKTYINVTIGIQVPNNVSTELYGALETLKGKVDAFLTEKNKLETRQGFNPENAYERSTLATLFDRYFDLVITANDFSQQFIDAYNTYNTIETADRADGRPAIGSINKYYLETLTSLADIYINVYLSNIYDLSHQTTNNGGDVEYYTSQNYIADLNSALASYLNIADIIENFENREGVMTSAEQAVVTQFHRILSYDLLFQNGYDMVLEIINNYDFDRLFDLDETDFTEEEVGNFENINNFFDCEYKNLTNMLETLSQFIVAA